ncbi:MAG TPA: hypothetical protein VF193_13250 [Steroidobacter sp.]
MARKRKPIPTKHNKRRQQAQSEAQQQKAVVEDTAARFTCAAETADDFAYHCTHAIEELDLDLLVHRLALEIWREHPDRAPALLEALEELLTERLRHRAMLERIGQRLQNLADDPAFHIHLEPVEPYRDLVRSRLFPQPPTKSS